jgi:hypothetical protein
VSDKHEESLSEPQNEQESVTLSDN